MMDRWLRVNWHLPVIGLLVLALFWQTMRIDGLRVGARLFGQDVWLVNRPGLKPRLAECQGTLGSVLRAQTEAEALQAAVNEDEERRTAANADRSDLSHAQDLDRAAAAGRSFADRNRITTGGVRAEEGNRGEGGQTVATAESGGAGVHEDMSADPFVAVASADVQTCTAAVTWAVGAYNWAQTLPRSGEADVEPIR